MSAAEPTRKVALVAGGSGGVGRAIVRALAADGFDVAIGYRRNRTAAVELAAQVAADDTRAEVVELDLSAEETARRGVVETVDRFGRIDVAIYAAGPYIPQKWIGAITGGEMREMLLGDAMACFHLLAAALEHLRVSSGAFLAISTPAARRHIKKDSLSSVPKAAIEAMVRAVAVEEGRFGVRANCVAIGFIEAGMYHELRERGDFDDRYVEAAKANIPLGRSGSDTDIANAIAFLARDSSSYVTGQTIAVDGGLGN